MTERRTVLIVDDELLIRWSLAQLLADSGYEIREAATGAAALRAFASGVDLVLLDLRLPDAHGLDLLERFKAMRPHVPVLVMSAHADARDESEARRLGAVAVLRKPFDLDLLVRRVDSTMSPVATQH